MSFRFTVCVVAATVISFGPICGSLLAQQTENDSAVSGDTETGAPNSADDLADARTAATTEIEAVIASYVAAFNARNPEQLAAHWSPTGVYISKSSGEQVTGREAMVVAWKQLFSGEDIPQLTVNTETIEFVSPNVAIERGQAFTSSGDIQISQTSYSVVYMKQAGSWLIDRVTEEEFVAAPSNREQLEPLSWMIGEWVDDPESVGVELNCQLTRNENFISVTFKVYDDAGIVSSSGLQIVGWDPTQNRFRSWLFDSEGAVVTGQWTESDGQWHIQSKAELGDGGQGSYTLVLRQLDDGNLSWHKMNQMVDGQLLPNTDELVLRKK